MDRRLIIKMVSKIIIKIKTLLFLTISIGPKKNINVKNIKLIIFNFVFLLNKSKPTHIVKFLQIKQIFSFTCFAFLTNLKIDFCEGNKN